MRLRPVLVALLALAIADFVVGIVTGSVFLLPLGSPVSLLALSVRAVAIAALAVTSCGPWTKEKAAWLVLALLLLPAAIQLQLAGGRINGDGVMYYVYVRSLMKDADLDFTNEYAHYGLAERDDLVMLTDTGRRRSIFAAGPGLAWTPFFALGEAVARAHRAAGGTVDLSGYGPHHRNAVALGSLLYGFAALALIHGVLRRYFTTTVALGATLLVWGTTFLHWYMVYQPTMAHATSAAGAAFVIWLWDRHRGRRGPTGFGVLGLATGLAMCLRWQNGVLLVLPAFELLERLFRRELRLPRATAAAALLCGGALVGAVPQMLAWKYIYGTYLLPHPPHGADFLRLGHPYLLQTLFSTRHGLLSWTPVFWLGFLGFVLLIRRRAALAVPLLVPLLLMTYVNACSGDWWAGASFSNRRFDSLLAIFAVGFAAAIEGLRGLVRRWPGAVPAAIGAAFVLWNAGLALPSHRDDPTAESFAASAGRAASVFADHLGSPTTWPASWIFAVRHGRPPGQYDLLVGRYLFYRQNNLRGRIDLGQPGDGAMIGEGFALPEVHAGAPCRLLTAPRGRLFAPLDVAEDLGVRVRTAATAAPVDVIVRVNGREAGRFTAGPDWCEREVLARAGMWHRELNEVSLEAPASSVYVDQVNFIRNPAEDGDTKS